MGRSSITRRTFMASSAAAACTLAAYGQNKAVLGQGDFKYRVVPDWGVLGDKTPVNNCHGIVTDREGHVNLFTDQTKNNVIVYD